MDETSQSKTQELPLLTFNSLYNLLREEKKSKSLQKLPELFYEAQDKFLEDKKIEIKKLKEAKESMKLRKENSILKNSKKIIIDLLALRQNKIANIAIENTLYGEEIISEENILEKEEKFFNSVKKGIIKL